MQNRIIIYEPIETEEDFSVEDSELYQKAKNNIDNIEVYVEFFEE